MLKPNWLAMCVFGATCTLSWANPCDALANSSRVPLAYHEREMSLPDGVMRFDAGARWPFFDAQFKHEVHRGSPDIDYINPGLTFSVDDDVDIGFVAPFRLSPDVGVEDPRVHALYQFDHSEVQLGMFGELRLGLVNQWQLVGGVPLMWDITNSVRLETGGFLEISFGDRSTLNVLIPAQLPIALSRRFYLGPEAGVQLNNLFDDGSNVSLPVGGFLGYSLGSPGSVLGDIYARVRLADIENGFNVVEVMLGTELFFDM